MEEEMKLYYKGDEITKIRVMGKLRTPIINLLGTYPIFYSFGIIETYFEKNFREIVVEWLEKDGFIEFASKKRIKELNKQLTPEQLELLKAEGKKEPIWYRLTSKGVDLAISFINLGHSEKVLKYNKEMIRLTEAIIVLTLITLSGLGIQIILSVLNN